MARAAFTTVHSEGALLSPDFLQRLVIGAKGIDGVSPESYHLVAGEKPKEGASRGWNRLQAAWAAFQTASQGLRAEDAGTDGRRTSSPPHPVRRKECATSTTTRSRASGPSPSAGEARPTPTSGRA